ncbi:MAG TPA: SRPBCC family protein [Steroidobacteraceae bacterium]|jgi:uncharacterized protein YndB with AHSA1/START domain|nr:SRPBCC family protein [Steroidobacteraceae bacterium]
MSKSKFVYATYIRTTPEKLWQALLSPEFTRVYWFGITLDCAWTKGAPWKMMYPDGRVTDSGEIVEIEEQKRIVIRWRNEFRPELRAEGYSQCTMEIEPMKGLVKLTILHEIDRPESKLIEAVSGGWPKILSNLKSLLETGSALPEFAAQVK